MTGPSVRGVGSGSPATRATWRARWGRFARLSDDPEVVDIHQKAVLARTRTASLIAALVMPATMLPFFLFIEPLPFRTLITVAVVADLAVLLLLGALRFGAFDRFYHLGFFLLVGIVCSGTEAVLYELSGGPRSSSFLFPYFFILFGIAALFPARLGWAVAAAFMCPATYVIAEVASRGKIASGQPTMVLLTLLNAAFIAVIANRVSTRTFISEVEHRRALETANEQLRELDRTKTDFFANLSHDLKTPLNLIIGPIQAVVQRHERLDDHSRRYLELALRGARRLDGMIHDLLELARIEAGVSVLHRTRVDLVALIGGFVETAVPYATSVGQQLEFVPPGTHCEAELDADKIERIVANLVGNALKFSPPGSTVRITLTSTAELVRIAVQDEGPGIPPEDRDHIFARFARGRDEGKRRTRGSGVGLAVVREFVEIHNGTVSLESAPGQGSTFMVTLPRVAPEGEEVRPATLRPPPRAVTPRATPLPASPASAMTPDRSPPRLLLVEDDDEARVFLTAELGRAIEVVAVADGETAVRLAGQRPDIVLLDVNLPGIDGIEALRQLRRHPATARVPVLVYSASGDLQTRLRAFDAGADDFVAKPVEPLEMRARVESLLRRSGRLGVAHEVTEPSTASRPKELPV